MMPLLTLAVIGALITGTTAAVAVPTIDAPDDGTTTNEREAVVEGRAPGGRGVELTVTVNRRRVVLEPSGNRFRVPVVLELGRNRITAKADNYEPSPSTQRTTVRSRPVELTRVRGAHTGTLNHATALWVAEAHSDVYSLCGESESCGATPACAWVANRRIDCPVEVDESGEKSATCGVVISVQLRGRRVYSSSYGCRGAWGPNPRRFVHRDVRRAGRRFRIDQWEYPWLAEEINHANRYGLPRFDVVRDLFIP